MTSEELYFANQKLVHDVLNKKFYNIRFNEDYQQEGRIGLWKACQTYNDDSGYTFSTYASKCIYNEILMALRKTDKHKGITIVSLDEPISSEGERITLKDVLEGEVGVDFVDWEYFRKCLTPLEKSICLLRLLGLNQCQIAKKLNYTRVHINRCMKKIRQKFNY